MPPLQNAREPHRLLSLLPFLAAAAGLGLCVKAVRPAAPAALIPPAKNTANEAAPLPLHKTASSARVPLTQLEARPPVDLEALLIEAHESFLERDSVHLGATLEELLIDPALALELLDGLQTQRWGRGEGALTPAEDGARIAIGAGAALYSSEQSPAELGFAGRFIGSSIESLRLMRPLLARCVAKELARAEVDGARVLGARWLPFILRLRWAHPEARHLYELLLEGVAESEDADSAAIAHLLFSDEEDPGLLRIALARLLKDDPAHWIGVANEWYERAESSAVRAALASAVTAAARPEDAARFLAHAASSRLHAQAASLAARNGGLEALADEYEARLSMGDDPAARRALVSGLARDPDLCLGIARTDPDRGVRGQALLSATVRTTSREAIDVVRAAWQSADDRHYGVEPRHLVWSAANAVSRVTPELRSEAVELLRSLASDPELPHEARADACARLSRWLPAHEHAALRAALSTHLTTDKNHPSPELR
jgi:hypothetical protein